MRLSTIFTLGLLSISPIATAGESSQSTSHEECYEPVSLDSLLPQEVLTLKLDRR